jgi:hypothetical protein
MIEKQLLNKLVQIFGTGVRAVVAANLNKESNGLHHCGRARDHVRRMQLEIDDFLSTQEDEEAGHE